MKLIDSEKLFDMIYYRYAEIDDNKIKEELANILAIIQLMPMYNEDTKKAESLPPLCSCISNISSSLCSITTDDNSVSPLTLGAIIR